MTNARCKLNKYKNDTYSRVAALFRSFKYVAIISFIHTKIASKFLYLTCCSAIACVYDGASQ